MRQSTADAILQSRISGSIAKETAREAIEQELSIISYNLRSSSEVAVTGIRKAGQFVGAETLNQLTQKLV